MRIGVLSDNHIHPGSTVRDNGPFSLYNLALCSIPTTVQNQMVKGTLSRDG